MKKILFIDRDGTILIEPPTDYQIDSLSKFKFVPGVISALKEIVSKTNYKLVLVSNQDGLGTERFPVSDYQPLQDLMLRVLESEGIVFENIYIDKSFPEEESPNRKPGIGMLSSYLNEYLDYNNSYVIGDRIGDMQLAKNIGVKGILLIGGNFTKMNSMSLKETIVLESDLWSQISNFILNGSRKSSILRKTAETSVTISLDLNNSGNYYIATGIDFFDHMLEQIAKHAEIDLDIKVKGDLNVDEHHTIEDTAIVLGQCFKKALGSKVGLQRYGFVLNKTRFEFGLVMDEAKSEVLLDFGGRSYLTWDVTFDREYVGDFPTEMTRHFFDSFCQECKCNLYISALGYNTHHKIEAIFKSFAHALKDAIKCSGSNMPSSKGVL